MKNSDVLFEQVQSEQCKKFGITSCIKDGILFPEDYKKSPFKIIFILKEPYSEWDDDNDKPESGDFDFYDIVRDLQEIIEKKSLNKTWIKVASIAYSLKNGTAYTENLNYEQIVEGLKCVCWINLSKTPWKTQTKMDSDFIDRTKAWEPVVKAQLKEAGEIGYNMVWFGDTWDLGPVNPVEPDVELVYDRDLVNPRWFHRTTEGGGVHNQLMISKHKKSDALLINTYHPGYGTSPAWTIQCIKDYKEKF